jgi:hypothetical protein
VLVVCANFHNIQGRLVSYIYVRADYLGGVFIYAHSCIFWCDVSHIEIVVKCI